MKSSNLTSLFFRLWNHLSPSRHKQFTLLVFLIIFASFAEVLSIGTVLPFLSVLTEPDIIFNMPASQQVLKWFNFTNSNQLLLPITIAFIISTLIAGATRLLLLWASTHLSFATGADLGIDIYRKTLYQPYKVHVARNSSEVISGITGKANGLVYSIIIPLINIIGSIFIIGSILIAIISINPLIFISAFVGFGLIYGLIALTARKRMELNSKIVAKEYSQVFKSLQEGLGGVRDVLLDGSQEVYCDIYKISDRRLRKAYAENVITGGGPRFIMEALGMVLIAGFAYITSQNSKGLLSTLPLLGSLAMGAQRMLPVLQQGYAAWISVKSNEGMLVDVLDLLDQPLPDYASKLILNPMSFQKKIVIENISFQYHPDGPIVLRNISFDILKGSKVGIIGITGSGKSSLLDIILALLEPSSGKLMVDDQIINTDSMRSWQANIAHVPQNIFLSDASIAENIAFGIPVQEIDFEKVRRAAKQAQISEHIDSLKNGYNTFVGERGIRLSGGQRQRIGIARALYKEAKVIVFDEATSALDNETEKAVMEAINGLGKDLTILMIAHRLSTVKDCDKIIELKDGEVIRIGKYDDLFTN